MKRYTQEQMTQRYIQDRMDPHFVGTDLLEWRSEQKAAYGHDAYDWLDATSTRIFAGPPLPLP